MILTFLRELPTSALSYDWRTKAEALLWYPDALAGVAREYLTDGQSAGFSFLQSTLTVTDICYLR